MADLITAADLRDHYPGLQGTGDDAYCLRLIGRADAALAIACGNPPTTLLTRTWTAASYDLRFDGPMGSIPQVLDLETKVLSTASAAISAVYADATWGFATAITSSDYVLDKERGWLFLTPSASSSWVDYPLGNRVVATGGFGTTPPEVIHACALTVKAMLEGGYRPEGHLSLAAGGRSLTRGEVARIVPRQALDLMAPWRGALGG